MSDWRAQLLARAFERKQRSIEKEAARYNQRLGRIERSYDMQRRIINSLRSPPEDIWGDDTVYVRVHEDDWKIPHDVAKALSVNLMKEAHYDGINYIGMTKEGTRVNVFGVTNPPGCRLVRKVRTVPAREEVYYEMQCGEGEESEQA